jgi:ketosteroid isomerase-like protein
MSTRFTRTPQEVRDVIDRFVATSRKGDAERNWAPLADFYAEDAVYKYTMGKAGMRVARGRDEVRRLVMMRDMAGFEGWEFPYEWVLVDGNKVITKWWNEAPAKREDGTPYRIVGNSNILLNDDLQIEEMHDNFDAEALFEMVRMLNRKGLTRIHIPKADEAEGL